jgi:type I restriction enzyme S subunit
MTNQIKTGYKQTEIGVIPEDWEVKTILNVAPLQRGFDLPNSKLEAGIYPVVCSNGIVNFHKIAMVKGAGVTTGRSGTLGKVHYIESDYFPHNTSLWVTNFFGNDVRFIYYLFTAIRLERFGSGSGVPTLNRNDVHDYKIPIPPKQEQTAIAAALSDVDALMGELDKLIAKKRDIKQATMQQLLTGKKRLAGFSGEWEVKKFKDVTDLITCGIAATPEYVNESEGVPFLSSTNVKNGQISWNNFKFISKELHNQLYKNNPPLKGDILYSRVGTIGEAAIVDVDFEFSIYVSLTLIKTSELNNEFLKQLLNSNTYKKLANNTVLMGGGVGNLNVNVVREFPISFPSIEEQTAIATILSDMDAEISQLEARRAKTAQLKQGMMQELLTGRIRLVSNNIIGETP